MRRLKLPADPRPYEERRERFKARRWWADMREGARILASRAFWREFAAYWSPAEIAKRLETLSDRRSPMLCRQCQQDEAMVAIRSGLEFHPTCEECARYWNPSRRYPLEEVAAGYYERTP